MSELSLPENLSKGVASQARAELKARAAADRPVRLSIAPEKPSLPPDEKLLEQQKDILKKINEPFPTDPLNKEQAQALKDKLYKDKLRRELGIKPEPRKGISPLDDTPDSRYSNSMKDGTPPIDNPVPGDTGSTSPAGDASNNINTTAAANESVAPVSPTAPDSGDVIATDTVTPPREKVSFKDAIHRNIELGVENQRGARETVKKNTEGLRNLFKKSVEVGKKVKDKTTEAAAFTKKSLQKAAEITAPARADLVEGAKKAIALGNSVAFESKGREDLRFATHDAIEDAQVAILLKSYEIHDSIIDTKNKVVETSKDAIVSLKREAKQALITDPVDAVKLIAKDWTPRLARHLANKTVEKSKAVATKTAEAAIIAGTAAKAVTYDAPKAAVIEVNRAANTKLTEGNLAFADLDDEINYRIADWTHRLTFNTMKRGISFINGMEARAIDLQHGVYTRSKERVDKYFSYRGEKAAGKKVSDYENKLRYYPDYKGSLEGKRDRKIDKSYEKYMNYQQTRENAQNMLDRASNLRMQVARIRELQPSRLQRNTETTPEAPADTIDTTGPTGTPPGGTI